MLWYTCIQTLTEANPLIIAQELQVHRSRLRHVNNGSIFFQAKCSVLEQWLRCLYNGLHLHWTDSNSPTYIHKDLYSANRINESEVLAQGEKMAKADWRWDFSSRLKVESLSREQMCAPMFVFTNSYWEIVISIPESNLLYSWRF